MLDHDAGRPASPDLVAVMRDMMRAQYEYAAGHCGPEATSAERVADAIGCAIDAPVAAGRAGMHPDALADLIDLSLAAAQSRLTAGSSEHRGLDVARQVIALLR